MRLRVVELLEKISEHEAGRHWWGALSRFEKLAYYRIKRESEAAIKAAEEKDGGIGDMSGMMLNSRIS